MDDDTQELIAIQQELSGISDRLRKIFPSTHPQFDNVFEDVGAAGYYIQEAGYRLESVLMTVQGDSVGSTSDAEISETEIE
ncbi:hypothetical protein HUN01_00035 (plasmid) [Nostoc edaphicum CCNP1411]|uniref:Uncharacterized protein n=1 Tax=Nostoc edaphicum CCNP1411 TaxID=1472755 RepID=A0A7D7Q8U1_9NOSO|nr:MULTISPECIES: hypothetical protein [Nostoc]ODH02838.1 hypothetical protein A4S05_22085 [Nostoc sp. KVJ20]QMS86057.1 hypothetical protein HUN01_00035 [Nostoc edaphicum CCNP1411]